MITFVVPAHNEEWFLPRTLQALHSAGDGVDEGYEIIVVDDTSSDRTTEVAVLEGVRVTQLGIGKSLQRVILGLEPRAETFWCSSTPIRSCRKRQ